MKAVTANEMRSIHGGYSATRMVSCPNCGKVYKSTKTYYIKWMRGYYQYAAYLDARNKALECCK